MNRFSRCVRFVTAIVPFSIAFVAFCGTHVWAQTQHDGDSTIEGRVTDSHTGRELANVRVSLQIKRWSVLSETETDAAGHYAFRGIKEGSYVIDLHPGMTHMLRATEQWKEGRVAAGATLRLDWSIEPSLTVHGVVVRSDGSPAARFPVAYATENIGDIGIVTTDDRGKFVAPGIPTQSRVSLRIKHEGQMTTLEQKWEIGETADEELVVKLYRAASISGVVLDADGRPMKDVTASARGFWSAGGSGTNEKGEFHIEYLSAGRHELWVMPMYEPERQQRIFEVDLAEGEEMKNVMMTYSPAMDDTITWRLIDLEGNALHGATAMIVDRDRRVVKSEPAGPMGTFMVRDLNPGEYYDMTGVNCNGIEYRTDALTGKLKARPGEGIAEVRVRMKERPAVHHVVLCVTSAEGGRPVPNFMYTIGKVREEPTPTEVPYYYLSGHVLVEVNDSTGQAVVEVYDKGAFSLAVQASGHAMWMELVNKPVDRLDVRLQPEAFVAGHAVDRDGHPISGAQVLYGRVDDRDSAPLKADRFGWLGATDENGYFQAGGLPAGAVALTLLHDDFEVTHLDMTATRGDSKAQDVLLRRAAAIEGTFYVDGKPCKGAHLQVVHPQTRKSNGAPKNVRADGTYRQTLSSLGEYLVQASIYDAKYNVREGLQEMTIRFSEGETVHQDFFFTSK